MIHQRTHPGLDVEGCFACRVSQVAITPSALGSENARMWKAEERSWDRDIPAYKRLRRDGTQPRTSKGAAALEARANTKAEVER